MGVLVNKVADIYSTFDVFAGEGYWVILFSILLVEGILFEGKASVSGLLHWYSDLGSGLCRTAKAPAM